MIQQQLTMILSPYITIYDLVVPGMADIIQNTAGSLHIDTMFIDRKTWNHAGRIKDTLQWVRIFILPDSLICIT